MMTLEEARAFFSGDVYATELSGITIEEVGERLVRCAMPVTPMHRNAAGAVMGGAIFTLADFAFAALTNGRGKVTVAQQVSINYLTAAKGTKAL